MAPSARRPTATATPTESDRCRRPPCVDRIFPQGGGSSVETRSRRTGYPRNDGPTHFTVSLEVYVCAARTDVRPATPTSKRPESSVACAERPVSRRNATGARAAGRVSAIRPTSSASGADRTRSNSSGRDSRGPADVYGAASSISVGSSISAPPVVTNRTCTSVSSIVCALIRSSRRSIASVS